MPLLLRDEPPLSLRIPTIYNTTVSPPKVHVVLFGSFHGGFHILRQFLREPLANVVRVIGVATDDPMQPFTHANVRLWRHPHTKAEEEWVAQMAKEHGIPVYRNRIRTPEFERMFVEDWAPDLCLMATFGQMIPRRIFTVPRLGFYNFHHSDTVWPTLATWDRPAFWWFVRASAPLLRPLVRRAALRLWTDDAAYAERLYARRQGEV